LKVRTLYFFLFLLTLSSCGFFQPKPAYFFVIRAEEGVFLSDYTENTGLLVMRELDPQVTAFIKEGKKEAKKISIEEMVQQIEANSYRDVAFLFYRDTNNNRLNIPLSFAGLEYDKESKELRIQVEFVADTYQIEEIALHHLTLFLG
jgi:hypothetical protein